jgi:hypothetical protein
VDRLPTNPCRCADLQMLIHLIDALFANQWNQPAMLMLMPTE